MVLDLVVREWFAKELYLSLPTNCLSRQNESSRVEFALVGPALWGLLLFLLLDLLSPEQLGLCLWV